MSHQRANVLRLAAGQALGLRRVARLQGAHVACRLQPGTPTALQIAQPHSPVQDTGERAVIDKQRQEAADLVEAKAMAAEEERARQWRIVRHARLLLMRRGACSAPPKAGSVSQ